MSEEQQSGVDLRQAVRIAIDSVKDLYRVQGFELKDLLLEEVERNDDVWLVTVGFTRPDTDRSAVVGAIGQSIAAKAIASASARRAFKRVRIDARTGEFLGMEIRLLPS